MSHKWSHGWLLFACLASSLWVGRAAAASPAGEAAEPQADTAVPEANDATGESRPETSGELGAGTELAEATDVETPDSVLAGALQARAKSVEALLAGELSTDVEAGELFVVGLDTLGADARVFAELIEAIGDAKRAAQEPTAKLDAPQGEAAAPEPMSALAQARARLRDAYVRFFVLDPAEAKALLDDHRAQVEEADRSQREARQLDAELGRVEARADQLEALLRGELAPEIDPTPLLVVDLLAERELLRAPHRSDRWVTPAAGSNDAGDPAEPATGPAKPDAAANPKVDGAEAEAEPSAAEAALRDAERRLDAARRAYLGLPVAERQALLTAHAASGEPARKLLPEEEPLPEEFVDAEAEQDAAEISDAENDAADAARQKEQALGVARRARTEALRVVAEERARLLGIKEAQALFAATLPRWKQEARELHEEALEWHRRVEESTADPEATDALYAEVRTALDAGRGALVHALERLSDPGGGVPRLATSLKEGALAVDEERGELQELAAQIEAEAAKLQRDQIEIGWEVADLLRDDIVLLNRDRLALLGRTSEQLREDLTGLGVDGRDQGRRELRQIGLELRYHAMSLPRDARAVTSLIERRPLDFVVRALELLVLLAVFRGWRARADELLGRWQRPPRGWSRTRIERLRARFFWYLKRIRKPLEWLALLTLLPLIVGSGPDMPELRLPWLAAMWILGGRAAVLTIDAIAARQSSYSVGYGGNAELRVRSLRVIGLTVAVVGLILSISSDIVGRGTIYRWVFQGCWVLAAPIGLWMVMRWRPIIFERIEAARRPNALTRWICANQTGPVGFAAAAVGGVYLLAQGFVEWILRQLSGLDTTRKVLAYLFRREVAKQAETAGSAPRGTRIEGRVFDHLGPQSAGTTAGVLRGPAKDLVEQAIELARGGASTLSAVVGERGAGKTTFLKRVIEASDETTCIVGCPPEGFQALLEALAVQFEAADYEEDTVAAAIREAGAAVICIDDAHRMIAPAVGGLEQIDHFTRFALAVGGDVSWIVAVQHAAWHFVGRARGERVFFDQVLVLPRWSEEDIAALIQSRSRAAGIEPSFDELVVASAAAEEGPNEGRRTELGYYRILWDHSGGNPAVALQAWRQSLFVQGDEERPVVRLFVEPSAAEIERLPQTLLFVLRAVVQLELASVEEIADCTQLPAPDVADALRFSVAHGYAEPVAGRFRLSWPWYRTITTVLTRQHLLVA